MHEEKFDNNNESNKFFSVVSVYNQPVDGTLIFAGMTKLIETTSIQQSSNISLSPTENTVLNSYRKFFSAKLTADDLNLSVHTVHAHIKSIRKKLNIPTGVSLKKFI